MKSVRLCLAVVFAALVFASLVWAHHSPSAIFDMSKKVTVSGTLTKVDWINPHIVVLVDSWRLESNPPSWFKTVGVTRADIAKGIGQMVTLEANPAKDGTSYGYMRKITFADGRSYELVNAAEADK